MRKVLAIDIGIRNLSMCLMSCTDPNDFQSFQIHLWETVDTLEADDHLCEAIQKNDKICNKKCTYKYKNDLEWTYTCKTHYPKDRPIEKANKFKKKLIKDYLLQTISEIVLTKIQKYHDDNIEEFEELTNIVIELQPTLNPRMKFISHIIYGKLVEIYMNSKVMIRFVSASIKLRAYTGPCIECKLKGGYAKRKWLAIQYIRWFLENKFSEQEMNKWLPYFEGKLVKPDLSDTSLMCINVLKK